MLTPHRINTSNKHRLSLAFKSTEYRVQELNRRTMKPPRNWPFLFFAPQGLILLYFMWTSLVPATYITENNTSISYRSTKNFVRINKVNKSASGDIIIPTNIDGKPVTSIREDAFRHCDKVRSITIPESVILIELPAFEGCTQLTRLIFEGDAPAIQDAFDLPSSTTIYAKKSAKGFDTVYGGLQVEILAENLPPQIP